MKKGRRKGKRKKRLFIVLIVLLVLEALYMTAVFAQVPFIKKWRTIYIETAMSTNNHQWLATRFIPKSVIDEVMASKQRDLDAQADKESSWDGNGNTAEVVEEGQLAALEAQDLNPEDEFYATYWEIDTDSVHAYFEANPDAAGGDYSSVLLEDLDGALNLEDVNGNQVLVIDTENNLLILGLSETSYKGKLAIIKDSSQVDLEATKKLGSFGEIIDDIATRADAVLAINGSGFIDPDGHGNGGTVNGLMVIDGDDFGTSYNTSWRFYGMKTDNHLYISNTMDSDLDNYRWAIQFLPGLIIDGELVVDGTYGMGIQPRTAIGQAENGDFMMLIIDGRQVGYSLGCTVADCADILMDYHAYQAANLDGGSSAVMWYKGQLITKPSSVSGDGRYLPNALIVRKAENVTDEDRGILAGTEAAAAQELQ